jgi:hypothetical protein
MNVVELILIWGTGTMALVGAVMWIGRDLFSKPIKK